MKTFRILKEGHRMFYPLAALAAFVMPALWISFHTGKTPYPKAALSGVSWHTLEMLFGFGMLLLAGYLPERLSGRSDAFGRSLVSGLGIFWLLERIVFLWPGLSPVWVYLSGLGFGALLVFGVFRLPSETAVRSFEFWFYGLLVLLFAFGKMLFLGGALGKESASLELGRQIGIDSLRLFVLYYFLAFASRGDVLATGTRARLLDTLSRSLLGWTLLAFLVSALPKNLVPAPVASILWLGAALLGLAVYIKNYTVMRRLAKELGIAVPMLEISYGFLIANFFEESLLALSPEAQSVVIHTFTAGSLGLFGLVIMHLHILHLYPDAPPYVTRSGKLLWAMYLCLLIGAILRLLFPVFWPEHYLMSLHHSSGWWTLAYALFLWRFGATLYRE